MNTPINNNPRRSLFNTIWDHLAPVKPPKTEAPAPNPALDTSPDTPPLTPEEYMAKATEEITMTAAKRATELRKLEDEIAYLDRKNKLIARLDVLSPPRRGLRGTLSKTATVTMDRSGKKQSGSIVAIIWRRLPLKPVIVPLVFTAIVLAVYAALR